MSEKKKIGLIGALIFISACLTPLLVFLWDKVEVLGLVGTFSLGLALLGGMMINYAKNGNIFQTKGKGTHDEENPLGNKIIRRAISISVLTIFLGMILVSDDLDEETGFIKFISEHYWKVFMTTIGFYFGTRALESAAAILKK